jgi:hypothetical protein
MKGAGLEDDRVYPVEDGLGGDRLDQEFGDAGVAGRIDAALFGMAAHHDDGQVDVGAVRAGADQPRELDAVQREHVVIDDGQIDGLVAENVQGHGAVGRFVNLVDAGGIQHGRGDGAHMLIVVHQQNGQRLKR